MRKQLFFKKHCMCATFTLLLLRRTIKDIEKRYQWCNCVLCIPYHIIQLIVSTLSTQSFHHFMADNHQQHINQWFCLCPIFYRQCAIDRNSLTMFCDASQYATVYLQSMVSSSASTRHVLLPPFYHAWREALSSRWTASDPDEKLRDSLHIVFASQVAHHVVYVKRMLHSTYPIQHYDVEAA